MIYFDEFLQQWKVWLELALMDSGMEYKAVAGEELATVKANSLMYLQAQREASPWLTNADASRDQIAWKMLERQLKALADKADRGSFNLSTKLHVDEQQIVIRLNFRYDLEQHVVYVS